MLVAGPAPLIGGGVFFWGIYPIVFLRDMPYSETMISFSPISSNAKTGKMPVSGSASSTCPSACPFKKQGCYAKYGPISWFWNKVNAGKVGISWDDFLNKIRALKDGTVWRHNQFGDLAGEDNAIDLAKLDELVEANRGRKGYSYTHKPVLDNAANAAAIAKANANGFTINLSGNNLDNADALKALNIAPVATIVPLDSPQSFFTKAGNKVVVCPAQTRDNVTCLSCQLCAKQRSVIVGFKAHGAGAKHVQQKALA